MMKMYIPVICSFIGKVSNGISERKMWFVNTNHGNESVVCEDTYHITI